MPADSNLECSYLFKVAVITVLSSFIHEQWSKISGLINVRANKKLNQLVNGQWALGPHPQQLRLRKRHFQHNCRLLLLEGTSPLRYQRGSHTLGCSLCLFFSLWLGFAKAAGVRFTEEILKGKESSLWWISLVFIAAGDDTKEK